MNKNKWIYWTIFAFLSCLCLFIYVFYRPLDIELNHILYSSFPNLMEWKKAIHEVLKPRNFFVYSLPAGIWVLLLTLLLKEINIGKLRLVHMPFSYSIFIEISQYFQWTDGTFDVIDLLTVFVAWIIALLSPNYFQIESWSRTKLLLFSSLGFVVLFFGNS